MELWRQYMPSASYPHVKGCAHGEHGRMLIMLHELHCHSVMVGTLTSMSHMQEVHDGADSATHSFQHSKTIIVLQYCPMAVVH